MHAEKRLDIYFIFNPFGAGKQDITVEVKEIRDKISAANRKFPGL